MVKNAHYAPKGNMAGSWHGPKEAAETAQKRTCRPHFRMSLSRFPWRKMLPAIVAFAIVLVQSSAGAALDRSALERRYSALKAEYEALKRSGADSTSFGPLVSDIQRSIAAGQFDRLGALLDQLDRELHRRGSSRASAGGPCRNTSSGAAARHAQLQSVGANLDSRIAAAIRDNPAYLRLVTLRAPKVSIDGGVGRNIRGFVDVAAQRDIIWLVLRGLATHDADDIDAALRALAYAFKYQAPAGNFFNNHGVSAVRAVGADAFFLQAFGRIYLLLADSRFRDCALPALDQLRAPLGRAMRWLANNTDELNRQDARATNRLFFDAVAFELNGMILQDQSLRQIGRTFARSGLANQRADGTFDEHGGADSSYQAVSILNIAGLLAHEDDPEWRARLKSAFSRATAWERTRIQPNGEIVVRGNSRTGLGQEEFMGRKKDVNYPEVALALLYASIVEGVPSLLAQGEAVISLLGRRLDLWSNGRE
jgi:hypothetical protein